MPLIQVTLAKGRSPEQLQAPRESIRVVLTECEPQHWFVGGETLADLRASGRR